MDSRETEVMTGEPAVYARCEECGQEIKWGEHCEECGWRLPFREVSSIRYLNVYLVQRNYGGPQEGGWYYNTRSLQLCQPVLTAHAESVAKTLACDEFSNEGRRSIYSVLGNAGEYEIYISRLPGPHFISEGSTYE